ncbi:MAG: D-glycerate dehydrogenase [marine benthic group bacterium]|nr:D-glycerate dehydrogenase [Gemmatimonadota bacterium]
MTDSPIVLVAPELRELAGDAPEWPAGHTTRFARPDVEHPAGTAERVSAVIPLVSQPVAEPELVRYPALEIVANYGVGTDNLDIRAIRDRGIEVTNTPDVLTDATADLAMGLILAAARRLREGLALASSGEWEGWHPTQLLGMGLQGRSLGILGAGRIGQATARRANAFGMAVVYWDRNPRPGFETELGARRAESVEELLSESDVVSVHLPLGRETEGLLDASAIASMRRGSVLVNTARGGIVETEALAAALREGHLAAAGLDVFPDEPEVPDPLRDLPNCYVLPHLGSATTEARTAMWRLAADNVRSVLAGGPPLTPVG